MGIKMDKPPREMNLSELSERCKSEIMNYQRGVGYDDQYCLEIFRRAMLRHNEEAWAMLLERFRETVARWMRRHANREAACRHANEEDYVNWAFERLWIAAENNPELDFQSLATALRYLYACLNGAIMDSLRAYSRPKEVPWPDPGFSDELPLGQTSAGGWEEDVEEKADGRDLMSIVKRMLPNEREQRLAELLFYRGLKPREIIRYCPGEFSSVKEIYRLHRNIMERLARNKDRIESLLSDEES